MLSPASRIPEPPGSSPPEPLPGFSHITRYWDPMHGTYAAKILPGEYYVTRHQELIVTVLGSCVSVCVRDPLRRIGGMNHFMLPSHSTNGGGWEVDDPSQATRYGSFAIETLLNELIKRGSRRRDLEIKVTGGGAVLAGMTNVGKMNVAFAREFLKAEGLHVVGEDVEDIYPRKVYYQPLTGRVRVLKLKKLANDTIFQREKAYATVLHAEPRRGAVELF